MEEYATITNAQELFEFLSKIKKPLREDLPLIVGEESDVEAGTVSVHAYETRETEGCLERGLQLIGHKISYK